MPPTSVQRLLFNDMSGNGNGSGLTSNERQQILDATINAYIMRDSQVSKWLDPRRDYDQECGYKDPRTLSSDDWRRMYDEDPIARRIVGFLPEECWQKPPEVYEDEDPNEVTQFEDAWQTLARSLRGESWFQDQEGNPIWEHLARLDRLSRIGQYGVMLLGLDDGEPMNQPVKGLEEEGTKPAGPKLDKEGKPTSNKVHYFDGRWRGEPYSLTFNAEEAKQGMGLKFLRSFSEDLAMVTRWESNPASPRFGQPVLYNVYLNDTNVIQSGTGLQLYNEQVHWSRVLHVADGLDSSEWLGTPSCRPCYKRLVDLTKLYGGSAEMYWQGAFPGISLETHPQLGGDVSIDKDDVRLQMKHYANSLQRYMAWSGMSAKMMSPTVVDPTQQIKVQIEAICILLGVPVRIFMGSERGELASSTDDTTWTDRVGYRRLSHITPRLIVPFIDRLILLGILPQPSAKRRKDQQTEAGIKTKTGYSIVWPDMKVLSEQQRATVAASVTQALSGYVQTGIMDLIEPLSYLTKVLGWSDKEARSYLEATVEKMKEQNPDLPDDELFAGKPPQQPGMGPDGQPLPEGAEGGEPAPEEEGFSWPDEEEEPTTQEAADNLATLDSDVELVANRYGLSDEEAEVLKARYLEQLGQED